MPPEISVIVPCYNEAGTIRGLLDAIRNQTLPHDRLEVVVADGGSTDRTREKISEFIQEHPQLDVSLVENPARAIPAALNVAIKHARGEILVRLDAHSEPAPDYLERCIETLDRTEAANVGGVWEIRPGKGTWISKSIAAAAAHPLGAGDARYRVSGEEGPVDTVPFGAYQRAWIKRVGSFNEQLLTNEDYEYNVRIREAGGVVWFSPSIRSIYYARDTLPELARQYARYGFWKARMLRIHPGSVRWRQVLPPIFALVTVLLALASPSWSLARLFLAVQWGAYAIVLLLGGLLEAIRSRAVSMFAGLPLALATMHLTWGSAFWWGLLTGIGKEQSDRKS